MNRYEVTPQFLMQVAQPVQDVVRHCEDQLLINIAKLFNGSPDDWRMPSMQWAAKKLQQIGGLNRQNLQIIARYYNLETGLTVDALQQTLLRALNTIDQQLYEASKIGLLNGNTVRGIDETMQRQLDLYQRQALHRMNMVNTTMLNSSLQAARMMVSDTTLYEKRMEKAQLALNEYTAEVVTGMTSRQQAVRKCIKDMSRRGLTGFVDRAGHQWTPQAYVNMDIRTTAHNVATESVFARCDQYGANLVQISSHAGARPLCEPYQGRLFDRSGGTGITRDLNGKAIRYSSWYTTSYGQPAGLLGINCGHFAYPFIPGYSVQTNQPTPNKQLNDQQYEESQRQRYLQRQVRKAKRLQAMLNAAGDTEGAAEALQGVRAAQHKVKVFCDETGRTRRYDREAVVAK